MRYIYLIKNNVNNKVYVGQTKNHTKRKAGHFYAARCGVLYPLYCSIRKHGVENFSFEVIEECDDDLANEREQFWVAKYDSFNQEKGYNLTSGGKALFKHTEKTRSIIREKRAQQVITPEHRKAISLSLIKSASTDKVRQSRRNGQANRAPPTLETKHKRSISHRKWCEDNREQMLMSRHKPRHCSLCKKIGHNKRNCKEKVL